jgi:flagellar biosynthesis/type III secretory pathway protein FliH
MAFMGCKAKYLEGYNDGQRDGYDQGYDEGYDDGFDDGWDGAYDAAYDEAMQYFASATYLDGYNDGFDDGFDEGAFVAQVDLDAAYNLGYDHGYDDGYDDGFIDGDYIGYNDGYDDGYGDGYDDGYDDGWFDAGDSAYDLGFNDGYDIGFDDGYDIGFDDGYDIGFDDGYDIGWDDGYVVGYDDGYWGLSEKSKATPLAKMAIQLKNDLVNAKLTAQLVKKFRDGVEDGMLFSEASATSKDLEKRNALVEKYTLKAMASQIEKSYGVKGKRALNIAKLSHHVSLAQSSREMTDADANAVSGALIGANLNEVKAAVGSTLKGDFSQMDKVVSKAAEVNETSPEHVSAIISKIFF